MKKLTTVLFVLFAMSCFGQVSKVFDDNTQQRQSVEVGDTIHAKYISASYGGTVVYAYGDTVFKFDGEYWNDVSSITIPVVESSHYAAKQGVCVNDFRISSSSYKEIVKFSFKNDSIQAVYTNIDSAAEAVVKEVSKIMQGRLDEKQRTIDSLQKIIQLKNANDCKLDHNQASWGASYRNENDEEIISTSSLGYIKILGKTICDPDTTIRNFLDFNQTWCNKLLPTIDPKSGERGFNGYRSIKEKKLLALHLTYVKDRPYYPFTEKWIPSTEIDKYHPEWVLDRYVLIGDVK